MGADIRGADFTNAKLIGANFRGAQAGLQRRWVVRLVVCSWIFSGFLGFLSASVSPAFLSILYPINLDSTTDIRGFFNNIVLPIMLAFFVIAPLLLQELRVGAVIGILTGAVAGTFTGAGSLAGAGAGAIAFILTFFPIVHAIAIAEAVAGAVAGAVAFVFAVAFAFTAPETFPVIRAFSFKGVEAVSDISDGAIAGAGTLGFTVASVVILADAYIRGRGWAEDRRFPSIRSFAIFCAAIGGTTFRSADLTDANFTQARLKSTDLRRAILTHTCWYNAKMLDRVCPYHFLLKRQQINWKVKC